MDTLIYIPFSLWGLNPFISKNLNYVFQAPTLKGIEIYKSHDYGLILRKDLTKADSIPISTIYSIQFPNNNYSQYAIGFSRFYGKFLISMNYDYNDNFKQGSFSIDYKNFDLSYFELFKMNNHLKFIYFGYTENFVFNYQILNDTPLIFLKVLKSHLIYSSDQREIYLNYSLSSRKISIIGGIYYNILLKYLNANYDFSSHFGIFKVDSRFIPTYFEDTIYLTQSHSIGLNYKFFEIGYIYNENLIPIDTTSFSFSRFHSINANINTKFFDLFILRNFKNSMEWIIKLKAYYEHYLRKDILVRPYFSAIYIENEFKIPIEDIFISRFGISFNLFGGLYIDINYSTNLFLESLWNYNIYGLFLRISLED
ncbi:MAG: hypothetical protein ABIL37_03765 [candidate division WOR-3 bacterium]